MEENEIYYIDKRFLGKITDVEDDGFLTTISGDIPVFKGQKIFKNAQDENIVMSNKAFNENYILVKRVERKQSKPQMSPFEEMYAKQLMEFGSLDNQEEDEKYIIGTQELINR